MTDHLKPAPRSIGEDNDWIQIPGSAAAGARPQPRRAAARFTQPSSVGAGTVFLAAGLGAFVGGTLWFGAFTTGVVVGPWPAAAAGLLTALTTAAGARSAAPGARSSIALTCYLVTVVVVLFALARRAELSVYGEIDWNRLQDALIRTHLSEPADLAALFVGAALAWWVAAALGKS